MNTSEAGFIGGPWTVCYDGQIDGPNGEFICAFRWESFKEFNEGQNAASARLIAASPDLYDAADNALNALIGCCVPAGGVDDRKTILEAQAMLRAAINKATGK